MRALIGVLIGCVAAASIAVAQSGSGPKPASKPITLDRKAPAASQLDESGSPALNRKAAPAADGAGAVSKAAADKPNAAAKPTGASKTSPGPSRSAAKLPGIVPERCEVKLINDIPLPAREPGVLMSLEANEGMLFKAGAVLGTIDDEEAVIQKRVKQMELKVEREKASDEIEVKFSIASNKVAVQEQESAYIANRKVPNAVPMSQVRERELNVVKTSLQIDKAKHDRLLAGLTADTKSGEVDLADLHISRRKIEAPFDGLVEQVYKHPGEWVAAGDAVLRFIRVDSMYVEGSISAKDWVPADVDGQSVSVVAQLPHGSRKFSGKVTSVSSEVSTNGDFRVRATVKNEFDRSARPILRPGLEVEMTIDRGANVASMK